MAAIRISKPGAHYGPCRDERCGHKDCAQLRADAQAKCIHCGRRIGYERNFFGGNGKPSEHESCLLAKIESERQQQRPEGGAA